MVNPEIMLAIVSSLAKVTVASPGLLPPLMVVTVSPPELVTVIALPLKLIFSLYVPGATRTVSPLTAALMPDWMVV